MQRGSERVFDLDKRFEEYRKNSTERQNANIIKQDNKISRIVVAVLTYHESDIHDRIFSMYKRT